METFGDKIKQKNKQNYVCDFCDYSTSRKSNILAHNLSVKHQHAVAGDTGDSNQQILSKSHKKILCNNCNKAYMSRNGLWKHKSKGNCHKNNNNNCITEIKNEFCEDIIIADNNLILRLIKENSELKNMMMEQHTMMLEQQNVVLEIAKNGTNNNNNNTVNSHNKAFNLQFFLNETCKDAMNITDFLDSIQLQLSDLEKMEEIGFVQGISNIIIKNLNALDVSKRPLHCTDKKRETIYIKDQGVWEKDEENTKIRGFVKKVAGKNARLLQVFKEKHPDYNQYHSKYSTQYNKLIIEAFGGKGDNDLEKEDKIIRNITKNIVVEK